MVCYSINGTDVAILNLLSSQDRTIATVPIYKPGNHKLAAVALVIFCMTSNVTLLVSSLVFVITLGENTG